MEKSNYIHWNLLESTYINSYYLFANILIYVYTYV